MRKVRISVAKLKETVILNKAKHIAEYDEAIGDYRKLVLKIAKENLKLAKTGILEEIRKAKSLPPPPTSYEAEYNRALRMLEMSADDTVEIEADVFNQLVMDEWDWKHQFASANSFYRAGLSSR